MVIYSEMENKHIISEELEQIAPLLNKVSKKPVQLVPAGYFEQLNFQKPNTAAPLVKMNKSRNVFRWAAAAVVTGILAMRDEPNAALS